MFTVACHESVTDIRNGNQSFDYREYHPLAPEINCRNAIEHCPGPVVWPLVPPSGTNWSCHYKLAEAGHKLSCPQSDGRVFRTAFPTSLCFQFSVVSLSHLGLVLLYIKQTCLTLTKAGDIRLGILGLIQ